MTTPDPQKAEERLDELDSRIEEQRRELAEMTGQDDEPRFIDSGEHGPVDDTIAPPG